MKYIIIYAVGYFISAGYFGVMNFRKYQRNYPNIADMEKENDIEFGIFTGMIKGLIWPILLPIEIITRMFI